MRRALASVGLLALLVGPAFGQTAGSAPSFDAAEVHLRARTSNAPFTGASGGDSANFDQRATRDGHAICRNLDLDRIHD